MSARCSSDASEHWGYPNPSAFMEVAIDLGELTPAQETEVSALRADAGLVLCEGHVATIVGTRGDDTLNATSSPDVIAGRGGDDTILRAEADDIVCP